MGKKTDDGTIGRQCGECGFRWGTSPGSHQDNVNCPCCGAEHADLVKEKEQATGG